MGDHLEQKLLSEAHERATQALSGLYGHEKVCEQRYQGILREVGLIRKNQEAFNRRMWAISGTIILLLLGIISGLVVYEFQQLSSSQVAGYEKNKAYPGQSKVNNIKGDNYVC